jgi:ABC-type transporter Mla maintaining outer membrane lipid asymmetry permease subunit MlaE
MRTTEQIDALEIMELTHAAILYYRRLWCYVENCLVVISIVLAGGEVAVRLNVGNSCTRYF